MGRIILTVPSEYEDERVDRFAAEQAGGLSRSYIQDLILSHDLLVNGSAVKPSFRLSCDDEIIIEIPENIEPEIRAENIPLDIVYEDSDVIVVNKPKGMVVHPAAGHYEGTLVNALMYHCKDLSGINGVLRPGIVHRIDKDTSGLLVCAKNDFAHSCLADQLKDHSITRRYQAICTGTFKDDKLTGTVTGSIGRSPNNRKLMAINVKKGRSAVTHYTVLSQNCGKSYIECVLETGRTHQIRVHMKSIGHPLLGDTAYGGKACEYKLNGEMLTGQTLHAKVLGFVHPRTGKYMEFDSDLPEYFIQLITKLGLKPYAPDIPLPL